MAESVKSVLYVDYDSIHRSLKASGGTAADRLAQRAAGWVAAIESGRLVVPKGKAPTRRRMQARRCYADPVLLGKGRLAFVACGFEVVDCPTAEGHQRNSAGLQIVLDAMDALAEDGPYDEFVLLSADSDLAPALQRLRAQGKSTVIYAPTGLGEDYRALSDGQVDEGLLLVLLEDEVPGSAGEAEPAPAPAPAEPRRARNAPAATAAPSPAAAANSATADRGEVEALARKINAATNVPLFAPRTFADLFRFLAQEIAERGYHFQDTAANVAARLAEAGRTATRRQVMFVVKGLALKGHVFSTTDSAERLAEVFREQVNYLVGNAGVELSERERELLPAWIAGRAAPERAAPPEPKPAPVPAGRGEADETKASRRKATAQRPAPPPVREPPPPREPSPQREPPPPREAPPPREPPPREPPPPREAREPAPRQAAAHAAAAKHQPPAPPEAPPPPPPPARTPPVQVKSIEEIRRAASASRPAPRSPAAPPSAAAPPPAKPTPQPAAPAARPATPARQPGGANRPAAAAGRAPQAEPAPAETRAAAPPSRPAEPDKEALESSILAAIAQAVDVLVEDGSATPASPGDEEAHGEPGEAPPAPEPGPSEGGDSDDIGDEIQRIIASYSRARQQGERS